ncbi:MAG TPA: pyruvate dehydrogenase (acetyl-transferring), homodimeric type, partial [Calditrichae bacterium]|nr:pyruvate dehydrogenase (acetyl-transferring), homodimeric type [Calditrichia bacterium]
LGPIQAIYQARFARYLQDRGIKDTSQQHVWAFLGDGETDEPETLGAITLAARERLDNLIFVINCNLQRLDGPVRGNGKIIQELEAIFRGAGWNVIKVIWGDDWDPLFEADKEGWLIRRLEESVDGDFQKYIVEDGAYIRKHFFGKYPQLLKLVEHLSDDQIKKLRLGGHDPEKVYAAYKAAVENEGAPTVILARTIKGYGLGEAGEGKNITHQQKKLNEAELKHFRDRFDIPIPDSKLPDAPFYRPDENSVEIQYLKDRRSKLRGFIPQRKVLVQKQEVPQREFFKEFYEGSEREVSTTMAFVRMLTLLMRHPKIGRFIVPIVPDEARTFGMESMFRQFGIYSHIGQLYEPVDADTFLYYKEAKNGQILEEGITEAGSMSSFTAAGTAYSNHGVDMIPFFIFYSMFGFQRVGDLIWAFADQRGRGFLIGATAGRTTLLGEGLQHQDGHSHVLANTVPNCLTYDPAFAFEIAIIVQDGLRRMYHDREDVFYYITVHNENYPQAPMPKGAEEG